MVGSKIEFRALTRPTVAPYYMGYPLDIGFC